MASKYIAEAIQFNNLMSQQIRSKSFETESLQQLKQDALQFLTIIYEDLLYLKSNVKALEQSQTVPELIQKQLSEILTLKKAFISEDFNSLINQKFPDFVPSQLDDVFQTGFQAFSQIQDVEDQAPKPSNSNLAVQKRDLQLKNAPPQEKTFLSDIINQKLGMKKLMLIPRYAARQFLRLANAGFLATAAPADAYGKYIFAGEIFKPEYGVWTAKIDQGVKVAEKVEKQGDMSITLILGRVFVQKQELIAESLQSGLYTARLVSAVNNDGEIIAPVVISRGDNDVGVQALLSYGKQQFQKLNKEEGSVKVDTEFESVEELFKIVFTSQNTLDNRKFVEIIQESLQKCQRYFENVKRYRSVRRLLQQYVKQDNGLSMGINIQSVECEESMNVNEIMQVKQLIIDYAYLQAINKLYQQYLVFEQENERNEPHDDMNQELFGKIDLAMKLYEKQLFIQEVDIPFEFKVSTIEQNLGNLVEKQLIKVTIFKDSTNLMSGTINLTKAMKVSSSGQVIRLGTDLSVELAKPLAININLQPKQLLPKIRIQVQVGSHAGDVIVPLKSGEDKNILDYSSDSLNYTIGYQLECTNLDQKQSQQQPFSRQNFDPNMNQELETVNSKQEKQTSSSLQQYKGGDFNKYRDQLSKFYDLETTAAKKYDPINYINLGQMTTGVNLSVLEGKKNRVKKVRTAKNSENDEHKRKLEFDEVWKAPLNEPLFLSQYLAAMRKIYQESHSDNTVEKLSIIYPQSKWLNPFLIQPFNWNHRPLYPVRILQRERGRTLHQLFLKQFNDQQTDSAQENITQGEFIEVSLNIIKLNFYETPIQTSQFQVAAKLTGSGCEAQSTELQFPQNQEVFISEKLEFSCPLPKVFRESEFIGYDASDEAIAQFPYALKIILYELEPETSSYIAESQVTIPLRSLFLKQALEGEIYLQTASIQLIATFDPPRAPMTNVPESKKGDIYFCNIESNQYTGQLPADFNQKMQRISQIQTRIGQLSAESSLNEQLMLKQFSAAQKRNYLKKYSIKQSYEQRGITLFVNNIKQNQLFINQLLPSDMQIQKLILQFNLKKIDDCIAFAAAVPFVPDVLVRYYTEQKLNFFQPETRMSLDEVFNVSGGDYYEHAILLQSLLSGCGYQAFVARISTQVLQNEYFVLLINDSETVLIDPVSTVQYDLLSPFLTKITQLFDNKKILISRQIDMRPSICEFDFQNIENWTILNVPTVQKHVELTELLLPILPKAAESLQVQIKSALRQFILDVREQKITKFNELVGNQLEEGDFGCLDAFNATLVEIKCAWEDSAVLIEKVQNSAIFETDSRYCEFVIGVKVRGFGNKFGFLEVFLGRLLPKVGGKPAGSGRIKLQGAKFGHGM